MGNYVMIPGVSIVHQKHGMELTDLLFDTLQEIESIALLLDHFPNSLSTNYSLELQNIPFGEDNSGVSFSRLQLAFLNTLAKVTAHYLLVKDWIVGQAVHNHFSNTSKLISPEVMRTFGVQ